MLTRRQLKSAKEFAAKRRLWSHASQKYPSMLQFFHKGQYLIFCDIGDNVIVKLSCVNVILAALTYFCRCVTVGIIETMNDCGVSNLRSISNADKMKMYFFSYNSSVFALLGLSFLLWNKNEQTRIDKESKNFSADYLFLTNALQDICTGAAEAHANHEKYAEL